MNAIVAAALVAASLTGAPAAERTLTVGPNGQYRTIQAAADVARPGDHIKIAPGTYAGGLTIRKSGSAGRPITFEGDGGTAIVQGGNGIQLGNKSWLRFVHLTVAGSARFGTYGDGGSDLEFRDFGVDGSQDGGLVLLNTNRVLVDRCDVRGTNARGTKADHEAISLADGTRDAEVRNCRVHDNGEEGIDVKYTQNARVKIHHNVVSNNRGPNIYVDSASDVEVYNNITHGTSGETKAGIALAVEDWAEVRLVDNVKIYNNVSYGNRQAGLSFWVQSTGAFSNVQIVNNTFHGNAAGAIAFDDADYRGTNVLRNNIFDRPTSHPAFTSENNVVVGAKGTFAPSSGTNVPFAPITTG